MLTNDSMQLRADSIRMPSNQKIVPKNWRDFQHYKDRSPPWIRLHRKLLDNKDFHKLPVESRALAPMLWLLASESIDGIIDADLEELAFRLRSDERSIKKALDPLLLRGFFEVVQNASATLAECSHVAVPETETETEQSSEQKQRKRQRQSFSGGAADAATPAPTAAVWKAYSEAYAERYGALPVRNATINGLLANFVARIGADEAPDVARFFVGHKHSLYVSAMHAVNLLLRDAEKLRTEWVTKRQVTQTQAAMTDRTQTTLNAFAPMIAEAKAKEAEDAQRNTA